MEKLRSRPTYSIVAVLRSTALRRVATNALDHHRATKRPVVPFLFAKNTRKIKGLNLALPNKPNGGLDKLFHSNDGSGSLDLPPCPRQNIEQGDPRSVSL